MTTHSKSSALQARAREWLASQGLYEPKPSSNLKPLDEEGMKRFAERWAHLPKAEFTSEEKEVLEASERRRMDGTGRYLTHEEVVRYHSLRDLLLQVREEAIEACARETDGLAEKWAASDNERHALALDRASICIRSLKDSKTSSGEAER